MGALTWRDRLIMWRGLKFAWKKGIFPMMLLMFGFYGIFLGLMNFHARGSPAFLRPAGLQYVVLLTLVVGVVVGLLAGSGLFSRQWSDLLLPVSWDSLVRARRRRGLPRLLLSTPLVPLLLSAEAIPVPVSVPLLLRLFLILCWTYVSGALTAYYLVIWSHIWLGRMRPEKAQRIARYAKPILLVSTYPLALVFVFGTLQGSPVVTAFLRALTHAAVMLILAQPLGAADLAGISASLLIPALLVAYAEPKDIRARLPQTLYLVSEAGGSLSPEKPLKPGLWTDLRLRFRARYRDLGNGSRAVSGLMLTLGLRGGMTIAALFFAGMSISIAAVLLVSGVGWHLAAFIGGGLLALFLPMLGVMYPTQVALPGTPGGYSTSRLLPFSGPELFRAHGILVWPVQLALAGYAAVFTYVVLGGPFAWLVFGAVLTSELLVTWAFQTGVFSGSGGPHGKGISTPRLQWGIGALCLFLLYPIEGYVAFSVVAPTDLILDAYMLLILGVNLLLIAGLTRVSVRRFANPPAEGIGLGTPPSGTSSRRAFP